VKPAVFHAEAEAELIAATAYYEARRAGLGRDFAAKIQAAIQRIRQMPQIYPVRHKDGMRKCPVQRFPYFVYYMELDTSIWIAAVAHTSRRPGYWARRSPP
jgi:plasmid stabilization system protein ParE